MAAALVCIGFAAIHFAEARQPRPAQTGGKERILAFPAVIGQKRTHRIQEKETLLDIARRYDLGFNELENLYPDLDPWLPPRGRTIDIPSQWIVPEGFQRGIVINIPEMRLYYFVSQKGEKSVLTFPVGIGQKSWPTPEGRFVVGDKRIHPTWTVPPSLRHKYDFETLAPGPDNPLGDFWLGLRNANYGIHGTNFAWSVGRTVTSGCIRLYPEDIRRLFPLVAIGTSVHIIYEPVKIAEHGGRVFIEVHPDIYGRIADFRQYGFAAFRGKRYIPAPDITLFLDALDRKDGMPVDITDCVRGRISATDAGYPTGEIDLN